MKEERKSVLDFCFVPNGQGAIPFSEWLKKQGLLQEKCGLVKIDHMPWLFHLFYDPESEFHFKGIIQNENSNDVSLSSIPKDSKPLCVMSFNKDGYSKYCQDYAAYWDWVKLRNNERYENTISHGKNYDAKNMMHTFRLLDMAEEIAKENKINVKRPNREFLLKIRSGEFEYEELLALAQSKMESVKNAFSESLLPMKPEYEFANELLVSIRRKFYERK